jgi:hypothetical protein
MKSTIKDGYVYIDSFKYHFFELVNTNETKIKNSRLSRPIAQNSNLFTCCLCKLPALNKYGDKCYCFHTPPENPITSYVICKSCVGKKTIEGIIDYLKLEVILS